MGYYYQEEQIYRDYQNAINSELSKLGDKKDNLILIEIARNVRNSMISKMNYEQSVHDCLERCFSLFQKAVNPSIFFTQRILDPYSDFFEQYYSLLVNSFDPDVIEEKSYYIRSLSETNAGTSLAPDVIVVRYFRVEGKQKYDLFGNLQVFDCLTNTETEQIISFISGNYMPLIDNNFEANGKSIFGIGYLKTLDTFQGRKHASMLLDEILNTSNTIAEIRGEEFTSMVTEAENDASGFFFKYGFRWPENVYYAQPPLIYNEKTGEKQFYEVPEHLMIYHIQRKMDLSKNFIMDAVRSLYYYWIIMKFKNDPNYSDMAKTNISKYVWETVFKDFMDSINAIPNESCKMVSPLDYIYTSMYKR